MKKILVILFLTQVFCLRAFSQDQNLDSDPNFRELAVWADSFVPATYTIVPTRLRQLENKFEKHRDEFTEPDQVEMEALQTKPRHTNVYAYFARLKAMYNSDSSELSKALVNKYPPDLVNQLLAAFDDPRHHRDAAMIWAKYELDRATDKESAQKNYDAEVAYIDAQKRNGGQAVGETAPESVANSGLSTLLIPSSEVLRRMMFETLAPALQTNFQHDGTTKNPGLGTTTPVTSAPFQD